MPLKRIFIVVSIILSSVFAFSQQQTADLGLWGGGAIPLTDYTRTEIFKSVNFNFGAFYRYNFNSRFSLRINGMYGKVGATGEMDGITQQPFNKNVFDLSALVEINYHDFIIGVEKMKFSPYVFTGIGLSMYPGIEGKGIFAPGIPIGVGVKYSLGKYFSVGAEASLRKLFNDELDNLNDPYTTGGLQKVSDLFHNNDWISYFGLTLSYKFYMGKKACPAYDALNL